MRTHDDPPNFSLAPWAFGALALALSLAAWDSLRLHPGVGAPEELGSVFYQVGDAADHWRHWLRFSGGAWTRLLQWGLLAAGGDWRWVYLLNAASLTLGAWGLWTLARELGGEAAAAWAVGLMCSSPFFFLQARTLFSYVQVTAAALGLVLALRRPLGKGAAFVLGVAAALLWLDYEGWLLVLPGAAAAWALTPRHRRAHGLAMGLGFLAGLAMVLGLSWPYLLDWWGQRSAQLAAPQGLGVTLLGMAGRLRSFFVGGTRPSAMGLEKWAAFPWVGLPGLAIALGGGPAWLWVWAGGGLLALAAPGPLQEPNRAIVAWPALLLLAALGSARLSVRRRWGVWLPRLALLAAPLMGFFFFQAAESHWDDRILGLSRRLMAAGAYLRSSGGRLGPALDPVDQSFLCRDQPGLCGQPQTPDTWFLMPRTLADPADPRWGLWQDFRSAPDAPPTWLLLPSPRARSWMMGAASAATALDGADGKPTLEALAYLRQTPALQGNALAWTLWRTQRSRFALRVGRAQAGDLLPLLKGPCLDPAPLQEAADALRPVRPDLAQRFDDRARSLEAPGERWRVAVADERP